MVDSGKRQTPTATPAEPGASDESLTAQSGLALMANICGRWALAALLRRSHAVIDLLLSLTQINVVSLWYRNVPFIVDRQRAANLGETSAVFR
jgi:hypothetical protein